MMNILDLQDKLKNLSQEQLIQEMQAPSGELPQFLVLSELTRRQKMRSAFEGQQGADQTTVAEDAVAAAGVPAGFAGQMAGAMAPQTDMEGNTAAMPQAPMMPEEPAPVPGMAGGGIVALRDGGRVGAPQLVVRNGRMFQLDPATGELRPMLGGVSGSMTEPRPSPRVMDPSAQPDLFGPKLGDVPPALPTASGAAMPTAQGDIGQVWEYESPAPLWDPTASRAPAPPGPESISGEPTGFLSRFLPDPHGDQLSPLSQTPLSGSNFGAEVPEGPAVIRGQRYTPEVRNRIGLFFDRIRAGGEIDTDSAEFQRFAQEFPEEAAAALAQDAELRSRISEREAFDRAGSTEDREPPADSDTDTDPTTDPQVDPTTDPQVDPTVDPDAPRDPAGPSGGIADIAGAAGGGQGPMSYEEEMLDMLAAREKRAEQDKWLALAQFGLALMSSKEPTLGGAIGEAGGPALDAVRAARETAEADRMAILGQIEQHRMGQAQLQLQRQAAAARARGGGGGSSQPSLEISAGEQRLLNFYRNEAERLASIAAGETGAPAYQREQAARDMQALDREMGAVFRGQTGLPFGVGQPAASSGGVMAPSARGQ